MAILFHCYDTDMAAWIPVVTSNSGLRVSGRMIPELQLSEMPAVNFHAAVSR